MKAQACSWQDMRKIQYILANVDRLKGQYEALMRCAAKGTVSDWRRALDVMQTLHGSDIRTVQPSHATLIGRYTPEDQWQDWIARCETHKWTVAELRSALIQAEADDATTKATATIPTGQYRTLVVDPPWSYGNKSGRQRPGYADRSLTLEQIAAFDIPRWVPSDDGGSHLYLWVTDAYAGEVYPIVRRWGFEPKTWLIWVKDRIGMGNYFRHQHEACVFAVRGQLRLKRLDASTVFTAPVTRHSEKPDAFYSLVESCSPGPYLDIFARRRRAGWDVFGDEADPTVAYQTRLDGANESRVVS
jgi:N6-adenosine-specific RNA methylase IME4